MDGVTEFNKDAQILKITQLFTFSRFKTSQNKLSGAVMITSWHGFVQPLKLSFHDPWLNSVIPLGNKLFLKRFLTQNSVFAAPRSVSFIVKVS